MTKKDLKRVIRRVDRLPRLGKTRPVVCRIARGDRRGAVADTTSVVPGMDPPREIMTDRRKEFDHMRKVRTQGGLTGGPGLGVREGLEDAAAVPRRACNYPLVDQEEQDRGLPPERHLRPEVRPAEVVLEAKPAIPRRLLEQRGEMFIVAVRSKISQSSGPRLGDFGVR